MGVRRPALTVLAVAATLIAPASAGAIVGGQPVPEGQLPFVANVSVAGVAGCTGTLVSARWVITAGHCGSATGAPTGGMLPSPVALPASAYELVLGTVRADGRGGERHAVSRVVVSSDYTVGNGAGSDVTLLELDRPSAIAPMRIIAPADRAAWRAGAMATIAGFGTTKQDGPTPDTMQVAQVPIIADESCGQKYPRGSGALGGDGFDPATMVCAGYPQGGTDTCQGDSGGPLLVDAAPGVTRLVGATSFGDGCAQPDKPGVYARLAEGPIATFLRSVVPDAFAPAAPRPAAQAPASSTGAGTKAPARKKAEAKKKRSVGHTHRHRHRRYAHAHRHVHRGAHRHTHHRNARR